MSVIGIGEIRHAPARDEIANCVVVGVFGYFLLRKFIPKPTPAPIAPPMVPEIAVMLLVMKSLAALGSFVWLNIMIVVIIDLVIILVMTFLSA